MILAGGDPSLRRDLKAICLRARENSLTCEVQTNGQVLTKSLRDSLPLLHRLYLSIDGPDAELHDDFRSKKGNFDRTLRLLRSAQEIELPVTVHSVASRRNIRNFPEIIDKIAGFTCVDTWSVLQFSPLGSGFHARRDHEITSKQWDDLVDKISSKANSGPRIAFLAAAEKKSLYAMISADGYAYRAADPAATSVSDEARVGSVLEHHLVDIARGWRIDASGHLGRYR